MYLQVEKKFKKSETGSFEQARLENPDQVRRFHGPIGNIRTFWFPAAILDKRCPIMSRITGHHWLAPLSYGTASSTGHQEVPTRPLTYFPPLFSPPWLPFSLVPTSFHARSLRRSVKPCHVQFPFVEPSLLTGRELFFPAGNETIVGYDFVARNSPKITRERFTRRKTSETRL